jgi:DNA-binding NtrC family response regulator
VVESALIAADGDVISLDLIPADVGRRPAPPSPCEAIRPFERQPILEVLRLTQFDEKDTARRLGLSLASLYRKLEGHTT